MLDDETRRVLNDLGYTSFGDEATWYYGKDKFIWQRARDKKWIAAMPAGQSPYFDSPVSAAAWLNVESA